MDELESALEGGIHARNEWGLEFSWQEFLEPLRTLKELVVQNQSLMRVSLDVLSALEAPMKEKPAQSEYSLLTLYQKPYGMVRRRNDENQILVTVDNRSRSEVRFSSVPDYIPPHTCSGTEVQTILLHYCRCIGIIDNTISRCHPLYPVYSCVICW